MIKGLEIKPLEKVLFLNTFVKVMAFTHLFFCVVHDLSGPELRVGRAGLTKVSPWATYLNYNFPQR
jgi:hypothetical protein